MMLEGIAIGDWLLLSEARIAGSSRIFRFAQDCEG